MKLIDFGTDVCGNLEIAETKEWPVTNGIGGYASLSGEIRLPIQMVAPSLLLHLSDHGLGSVSEIF